MAVRGDFAVRVVQTGTDLRDHPQGQVGRKHLTRFSQAAQNRFEIATRQILHGDEQLAIDVGELEDGHDVAVMELNHHVGLVDELVDERAVPGQMGQNTFDCHPVGEVRSTLDFGEIDLAHPPRGETPEQCVSAKGANGVHGSQARSWRSLEA